MKRVNLYNLKHFFGIRKWMKLHGIKKFHVTLLGNIIIDQHTSLDSCEIEELPYKIHKVKGFFVVRPTRIGESKLKTLKNFPDIVEGKFDISFNDNLNDLIGGPSYVGGAYSCTACHLKSFEGLADYIEKFLYAPHNDAVSLEPLKKSRVKTCLYNLTRNKFEMTTENIQWMSGNTIIDETTDPKLNTDWWFL